MAFTEGIKKWWVNLPEKKKYLEIVTALLSIPVLATAILLNLGSLKNKDANNKPSQSGSVTVIPVEFKDKGVSPTSQQCKKEVGPVEIVYPKEDQTISENLVCIEIAQKSGDYCSVEWSFKLDDGERSAFTNKQFCFNNLSIGKHVLEVVVRSTVSQDQTLLERNFNYKSSSTPTPATTSAVIQEP